ncbi:MAG: sugar phosphate isomerase/epimerase [Chloroflexota bacterium]|nr:MAG: sugar phosphate isomerase/epimerase [Chloroflexota bacterium]
MATNPIALQMYTLRDEAQKDFKGTLRAVAEMGYGAVELAGLGGLSPRELRAELDALGLKVSGAHVPIERLEGELAAAIEELQILGGRFLIVPWLPPERRSSVEAYRSLGAKLNEIGRAAQAQGLQLCYHHHDFELTRFGDTTGLHAMRDATDPALVKFEIDIYWAAYAGFDPAALIGEFSGRVPLVHLKDMKEGSRVFAEVGHGTLDIPGVIAAAETAGAEWFIVEQDRCERPALESVRMSLEYLRGLGRA